MNKIYKKIYYITPFILLLISAYCIFNNYLWADEAFSLVIIEKTYYEMIYNLSIDMHPPVFFLILKFGAHLFQPVFGGNIIYSAKFISFLPIILLVITGFTLVRKLYGDLVSFLFNIFIISMPEMLIYAVEIRMYSYALLFITISFLYSIKILRENKIKDWILFTIFTILSTYTHYFSTITSMIIYFIMMLYVIIKDKYLIKRFFISAFTIVIVFTPWLFLQISKLFSGGMIENFWIAKPTFSDIISYIKFPFSVMKFHIIGYILIFITFFIILLLFYNILRHKENTELYNALFAISIVVFVTLFGLSISLLIKPIFVRRYMVPTLGCFWLGIAISIKNIFKKDNIINFIIITYLFSGIIVIPERIIIEYDYSKELEKMYIILDNNIDENTIIITNIHTVQQPLAYYYPTNKIYLLGESNLSLLYDNTFDINYVIKIKSLNEINNIQKENYIFASSSDKFFTEYNINKSDLINIGNYYLDNAGTVEFYKYK